MTMQTHDDFARHYRNVRARLSRPVTKPDRPKPTVIVRPAVAFDPNASKRRNIDREVKALVQAIQDSEKLTEIFLAKGSNRIIKEVCKKHGLSRSDMGSNSRKSPVVRMRQEIAYRLHHEITPRLSLPHIGILMGGFDHTTVLHGIRQHTKLLARLAGEQHA